MSCELKELLTHLVESFQVLLSKMGVCHSFYRDWGAGAGEDALESLKDAVYGMCYSVFTAKLPAPCPVECGAAAPHGCPPQASLVTSHFTFLTIHSTNTLWLYIIWRFT